MKVSVMGGRYGKETAALLTVTCDRSIEVYFGVPGGKHPDLWVLTDGDADCLQKWKQSIRPQDIVLLNSDEGRLLSCVAGLTCNTVTFGYHLKSTVTLSGTEEDVTTGRISYVFALQRPMLTYQGTQLEPCELRVALPGGISPQSAMAVGAFLLATEVAFFP